MYAASLRVAASSAASKSCAACQIPPGLIKITQASERHELVAVLDPHEQWIVRVIANHASPRRDLAADSFCAELRESVRAVDAPSMVDAVVLHCADRRGKKSDELVDAKRNVRRETRSAWMM